MMMIAVLPSVARQDVRRRLADGLRTGLHRVCYILFVHRNLFSINTCIPFGAPRCNRTAEPLGCNAEGIIGKICPWSFCKAGCVHVEIRKFFLRCRYWYCFCVLWCCDGQY